MEGKVPTAWGEPLAHEGGVSLWLRTPRPNDGGPLFVHGAVVDTDERVRAVDLAAADERRPAMAQGMPSPTLAARTRAIFWGVATSIDELSIEVTLESGRRVRIPVPAASPRPTVEVSAPPKASAVAICMATHEPPPELLERQIESIVNQTEGDWVCLISDDSSSEAALARIEQATSGDSRFVVSRHTARLGAYANFGAAMGMVPDDATLVALSDQDDVWHPDKLARLGDALESSGARLAFSDMRILKAGGEVLSDTYWTTRQPNHANFASLLLGNSVTGAASIFRRDLLDDALPLPPKFGNLYHDHWLALVAAASGDIEYLDERLYDYIQHERAVIGHAGANRGVVGGSFARRLGALRGRPPGRLREEWRRIYFGEYCRMALTAVALRQRLGERLGASERRTLERALALDHSPAAVAWLTARQLRRLRRDDTGGSEAGMLRGLAWRRGIGRADGSDPLDDADLPPEMLSADV
jgi:glycosyltransferase involved in cell wall biosynthesis